MQFRIVRARGPTRTRSHEFVARIRRRNERVGMSTELPESTVAPADLPPTAPTRRTFMATTTAVGGAVVAGGLVAGTSPFGAQEAAAAEAPPTSRVSLTVNGKRHTVTVDNRTSLLDLLRPFTPSLGLPRRGRRRRLMAAATAGVRSCWDRSPPLPGLSLR